MAVDQHVVTPALPGSIWLLAWASLAGQVMVLLSVGGHWDDDGSVLISSAVGAAVVGYVSAGVVRARTLRLVLAWVVMGLGVVAELLGVVFADGVGDFTVSVLLLATSVVTLVALARFHRTDWFRWQRTKPSADEGASIGRLVAIGALVGILGGISGPVENGFQVDVKVSDVHRSDSVRAQAAGDGVWALE